MIILKKSVDIFLSNSGYLEPSFQSLNKVIENRLYNFAKDREQIVIQRMSRDTTDLLGGELYKLSAVAKGKISTKNSGIQLDLKVQLLPLFKWILSTIFIIFGITIWMAFDHSVQAGKTISVLTAIICGIPYWLFYKGVANFKKDLISDLKYLDSETETLK